MMDKDTTTIRILRSQRDVLKLIASLERRNLQDIINMIVEDYIQRHKETLEILSNPEWVKIMDEGLEEVEKNVKGIPIDELED